MHTKMDIKFLARHGSSLLQLYYEMLRQEGHEFKVNFSYIHRKTLFQMRSGVGLGEMA